METKLNIAEILKDKPEGTKLYSPLFGDVYLSYVKDGIINVQHHGGITKFFDNGRYYNYSEAEPLLFPSKEMRDWSKFSWKKGDVLMAGVDNFCIFDKWNNDEYTEFDAAFVTPDYRSDVLKTKYWHKVISETIIKRYISNIERNYGGKLNLTTLEIEKAQPEFKDGDIVFVRCKRYCFIEIFNYFKNDNLNDYASINTTLQMVDIGGEYPIFKDEIVEIHLATDSEKKQLFDALAKKNKAWDAEKKQIVDLKPKWTPKPFDRVITRTPDTPWTANFFSHIDSDGVKNCIDDRYLMCLPYNEETAKLIGTTNNAK